MPTSPYTLSTMPGHIAAAFFMTLARHSAPHACSFARAYENEASDVEFDRYLDCLYSA